MVKVITAVRLPPQTDREAFAEGLLGPGLAQLREDRGLRRLVVNVGGIRPAGFDAAPVYDLVVQSWWDDDAPPDLGLHLPAGATCYDYLVAERVQLAPPAPVAEGARDGVKAIYFVRRHEGLDNREARARWDSHAGTARRHHAGMVEYVQNGVIRPLDAAAPVVHGIAELHFPSLTDLEERLYDSPEGRKAVQEDVQGLVAEAHPVYTTEHVLLAGPRT